LAWLVSHCESGDGLRYCSVCRLSNTDFTR
jgi:hypothetical protein